MTVNNTDTIDSIPGPQTAEQYESTHDWRSGTIWDVPAAEREYLNRAIARAKELGQDRSKTSYTVEDRAWPDP